MATPPSSEEELRQALDLAQAAVDASGGQPETLEALAATQAAAGDFAAAQETQRLALERSEPEARLAREQRLARYERELTLVEPAPAAKPKARMPQAR